MRIDGLFTLLNLEDWWVEKYNRKTYYKVIKKLHLRIFQKKMQIDKFISILLTKKEYF